MPRESGETVAQAARRHFARQGHGLSWWGRKRAKFAEGYAEGKAERKTPAGKLWLCAWFIWLSGFFGALDAFREDGREATWGNVAVSAAWPLVIAYECARADYLAHRPPAPSHQKTFEPLRT